jgi:methionyl-tRNA formyltransferase
MRILFLGGDDSPVLEWLRRGADEVVATTDRLTGEEVEQLAPDRIVSHGYRFIVPTAVCERFDGRAVNLHISLLPWNRGSDPNLWSWIEDTPKGVSIHQLSAGLDEGDLVAQRAIALGPDETLASSYARLQNELLELFVDTWPSIRAGTAPRTSQPPGGSFHRTADRAAVEHLLTAGWDTPVSSLRPSPT